MCWLASVVCLTEWRFTWGMDLWKRLWGCVSWWGKTFGGTIPCLNSGLWKQRKGREEQHMVITVPILSVSVMWPAASSFLCLDLLLKMDCTLGLWDRRNPVSVQLLPRESSIMAVGKETDRINGRWVYIFLGHGNNLISFPNLFLIGCINNRDETA